MPHSSIVPHGTGLEDAWKRVENHLINSIDDPEHPFRYPTIATVTTDRAPAQRSVVLRRAERLRRVLFYTDIRSGKISDIRLNPKVHMHFYDHSVRLQLLLKGRAELHHHDSLAEKEWNETGKKGAKSYTSLKTPGEQISAPNEAHEFDSVNPAHFCVVDVAMFEAEFLQLQESGHLRSRQIFESDEVEMNWIAP